MNKKQKKMIVRIVIAAVLLIALHFVPVDGVWKFVLYLVPYLVIGYDILIKAGKGIKNRQVFDENFLMAIATIGAFIIAVTNSGDYVEAIAVMLFYQIGEFFQSYAVGKSRKNISELMDIRPDYANVEQDGKPCPGLTQTRLKQVRSSLSSPAKRCQSTVLWLRALPVSTPAPSRERERPQRRRRGRRDNKWLH